MLRATYDQETIRRWADDHGLIPATVDDLSNGPDPVGELTFAEPGGSYGTVRSIDWSEFFDKFEDDDLALVFDDEEEDEESSAGEPVFRFAERARLAEQQLLDEDGGALT